MTSNSQKALLASLRPGKDKADQPEQKLGASRAGAVPPSNAQKGQPTLSATPPQIKTPARTAVPAIRRGRPAKDAEATQLKTVSVRLSADTMDAVEILAGSKKMSVNALIREAVAQYMVPHAEAVAKIRECYAKL